MRILTRGDDKVHLRWEVIEQKGEGLVYRFGVNQMVVVKDEDEALWGGGDVVEEHGQQ